MYYYCYRITNTINSKIYIGVHKTKNLEDEYMGSGVVLKKAIEKYGPENFKKEILKFFSSEPEMYSYEKGLVNGDLIKSGSSYNIKMGGFGGFDYLNSTGLNNSTKSKEDMAEKARLIWQNRSEECKEKHRQRASDKMKLCHELGKIPHVPNKGSKGYKHTDLAKKSMSERNIGKGNSQFGTKWINNQIINRKIKSQELYDYLNSGWFLGKIKKVDKC